MGKGNPKAYLNVKNNPVSDNPVMTADENTKMIMLCMETFNHPAPDLDNPREVAATISEYFQACIDKELRPGNLGLYAWLGLDKKQVNHILAGRMKANPATVDLLKKAIKSLATYRETLGSQGKLNPITLLFWQKNFDHMEDKQQLEVSAAGNSAPEQTPEQIAAAIEADIPGDD